MSKEQAESLETANGGDLPTWSYENSAYWLGSARDNNCVWFVYYDGYIISSHQCDIADYVGVRPVITIAKSDL